MSHNHQYRRILQELHINKSQQKIQTHLIVKFKNYINQTLISIASSFPRLNIHSGPETLCITSPINNLIQKNAD